ncbi:hypothetical protein EJB05_40270 [Eragrostis curvula]|uniref:J domain-containing protein n=1 Tax=Eragrostis curvula TaxID=38414 RepID=A0A5J9TZM7_9POAL|nr:hypothetical protein EJB05_40270 [Eragrostis curvula]
MQAAAPWMMMKTLPVLWRNQLFDPTRLAAASSFHTTPISSEKWKNKWDCPKSEKGARKASRNYERYVVRQKRAEGKKALKDYLLYGKPSPHVQVKHSTAFFIMMEVQEVLPILIMFLGSRPLGKDIILIGHRNLDKEYTITERVEKKDEARFCNFFHEDQYVHPDDLFEAIFGSHRGFTWSHMSWEGFRFRDKSFRYRWTRESNKETCSSDSEDESEDDTRETTSIGSHAHRTILGLPPCGPLTLDDVKSAFRASALRWHPDRHPDSSQAMAEEKFKLCVNAYNSLCSVLKAA